MVNNWWDKFLDLFTEEVIDEKEIAYSDQETERQDQGYRKPPIEHGSYRSQQRNESYRKPPIEHGSYRSQQRDVSYRKPIENHRSFRSQKRFGRIEEGRRPVQPRMINYYPQTRNMERPIVDDRRGAIQRPPRRRHETSLEPGQERGSSEEGRVRRRSRDPEEKVERPRREPRQNAESERIRQPERSNRMRESEMRPVREKFTGVDFRAAEIPSPVYGFRQRPNANVENPRRHSPDKRTEESNEPVSEHQEHRNADNERWDYRADTSDRDHPHEEIEGRDQLREENEDHSVTDLPTDEQAVSQEAVDNDLSESKEANEFYTSPLEDLYFYGRSHEDEAEVSSSDVSQDLREPAVISESAKVHDEDVDSFRGTEEGGESDPIETKESIDRFHSEPRNFEEADSTQHSNVESSQNTAYISPHREHAPSKPVNVMMFRSDRAKIEKENHRSRRGYTLPPLELLSLPVQQSDDDEDWIADQREILAETLRHFNVKAKVVGVTRGPAVTRFEVQPAPGVKVSKIKKLNDDLKLSLAAKDIRIEAPIPGKSSVGIEIPNRTSQPVYLRGMIESEAFRNSQSTLTAALGLDISGTPIVTDLQKMPHGLIGGATGSGKSVCINSLLVSLLYKATPDDVKLILIDPKVVELAPFRDIPHLAAPVINDPKEAALALKWAVEEMERRYGKFAEAGARDIARYNKRADESEHMPYIVIVIDELADLMMAAPHDVEESICRIAQKARACGIHLVLATQRPSVDVITGLIKANIPTRLAFSVSSQADSRTILDMGGAEKLLGHGDMLFVENGAPQSIRVQGNFVSDDEIDRIIDFVKKQGKPDYLFEKDELKPAPAEVGDEDELFEDACFFVFEQGSASASALQRKFRIGYNRAARLIDMMEARGMISATMGSKPRDLLISEEEFLETMVDREN